jgi:hypothetical protein
MNLPFEQPYVYHGTAPDDILNILLFGLECREDRDGISVTLESKRAKRWAGLKTGSNQFLLRIPSSELTQCVADNLTPADPELDFIVQKQISPVVIEIKDGRKWISLFELYGYMFSEEERSDWNNRWMGKEISHVENVDKQIEF